MYLTVSPADPIIIPTTFSFTVPGDQRWSLRSIRASATVDVGGSPNRVYTLTITNGTVIVAQVGAADAGGEPGTRVITWADLPAASVAAGTEGISVAPLPPVMLNPGYEIIGEINNGAVADQWDDVVAWYDYAYTA